MKTFEYGIKQLGLLCEHITSLEYKIILLKGDLASGKTTLTKSFVSYLKLKDIVSSPTFSILNIYSDQVYHYDIYQDGYEKFLELGLIENLDNGKYHIIEWADESLENLLNQFGFKYIKIEISPSIENKRKYSVSHN
ncbi:MAG: TsaE protein, required for threonylcarbamoyladenosine t(6)A37 formation in tRNA [uncultured Campylobacterales bacterium]|uniref:tRNA threonylcarbamoyladenosine biosynthesis protein TsaE n=1 Tax=uncultured Campylobacterales bacterium TaxID=352960 RepID=A0A6S6SBF5_9BACT|nr:MAG: TsaE protein, required for threonylcarbamoyladenosine t(6)A37 formation in tRNA [uncultured Campylobacterales bacterium]